MSQFSHVIVGGGAVGLSIGAHLARAGKRILVLEKHAQVGQETSARNSEVIHAGIYHPPESLRTKLCIRGKQLIYKNAESNGIEYRQCGKWLVAQDEEQMSTLEAMIERAKLTKVPLEWVPLIKGREMEPAIIAKAGILNSPTTGIISAHSLMSYFEAEIQKYEGDIAVNTEVTGITKKSEGYSIACKSEGEDIEITTDSVINSAGLYAPSVSNMLLPKERHITAYYGKGSYWSYPLSQPKVNRLVYPAPASYACYGTHLTIDLAGRIRFGPDFEWVDSPTDLKASVGNLEAAKDEIRQYMDIDLNVLEPDYAGIRPKTKHTSDFIDFTIREEEGFPGFINLLDIESPGLTASWAIGEYIEKNFS